MAQPAQRVTMMYPPIEELLEKVDSKFTLVSLSAKRGRQINSYFSQLGEGLGAIVPPQVASVSRKPLSIALLPPHAPACLLVLIVAGLALHIGAGGTGIVSGYTAILARKGGQYSLIARMPADPSQN